MQQTGDFPANKRRMKRILGALQGFAIGQLALVGLQLALFVWSLLNFDIELPPTIFPHDIRQDLLLQLLAQCTIHAIVFLGTLLLLRYWRRIKLFLNPDKTASNPRVLFLKSILIICIGANGLKLVNYLWPIALHLLEDSASFIAINPFGVLFFSTTTAVMIFGLLTLIYVQKVAAWKINQ